MIRILAVLAFLCAGSAMAASVPPITGPQDPADFNATMNRVINNINAIIAPLTGGMGPAGAPAVGGSTISLSPSSATGPIVIAPAPGGAANTGIQIKPNGSGDIILFGSSGTGHLQFANSVAFTKATGFAACPGVVPGKAPLGVEGTVTSYLIVKDWLGVSHGWATC